MTRYLGLLQLSAEEARRIIDGGLIERQTFFEHLVAEAGGIVESFWLTDTGEWDVVCVVDMGGRSGDATPAPGAAATLARRSSGLTRREQWIALAEPDDVAAAVEHLRSGAVGRHPTS